jgi:hypothetical protein
MKVCIFSESPADEAAIRILVEALRGISTSPVDPPRLQARNWQAVISLLPTVIKHLYYHTDADALVAVVDSDKSPIHTDAHQEAGGGEKKCRLCALQEAAEKTQANLRPAPGRSGLKIAVGLAVPAMEAWYLSGRDRSVGEAGWAMGLKEGRYPYTSAQLKERVYGTDRPSLERELEWARREAHRVAQDLAPLEAFFPAGFGHLAREVRAWSIRR